jgi:putative ABC transport system permease protein
MDWIRQDAVTAIRGFLRSPGFTVAVVITLALGIGANTAIFSVVYAVLLRPLPYLQPDRLVTIQTVLGTSEEKYTLRMADYLDLRARSKSFEQSALIRRGESVNLTGTGDPERIRAASVTPSLFPMLGVQPLLGRTFREEETQPGHDRVVLISHSFWQNRLAGRRDVLSVQLQINGDTCDIIGVLAAGFDMPDTDTELWRPLIVPTAEIQARIMMKYLGFARLSPGISLDAARSDLRGIAAALASEYPRTNKDARFVLAPLQETRSGAARTPLAALLGTVLLVVLIGCANVANLLLVRATGRHQEMAVRAAMGASRARLRRQMWMEVLLLTGVGTLAGIATAAVALRWILALAPSDTPGMQDASINLWVLAFSIGLSLITALLVGAAPASMVSQADGIDALRQRTGSSGSLLARRARNGSAFAQLRGATAREPGRST